MVAALLVGLVAAPVSAAVADPFDEHNALYQRIDQIAGAKTWTAGDPSVVVAVIDTGVAVNADLPTDRFVTGYDFAAHDPVPYDQDNHGTFVAGLIASTPGNGIGASGICPQCKIMPIRAMSKPAAGISPGDPEDVADGIIFAADHGARIAYLGNYVDGSDPVVADAIDYAAAKDVLMISPAESGSTTPVYPAAYDSVLAVGGVNLVGTPYLSNLNTANSRWIDVAATAFGYATGSIQTTALLSGTYASAAVVAGAAGLAYTIKPDLTAAELRQKIIESASPIPGKPDYNPPVFDASRLLAAVGATDTAGPVITSTGLTDGQLVGPKADPTVVPVASDDHAIERTEVLLDGVLIGEWRPWTVQGYTVRLPVADVPDGTHQLTARAYDYGGNVAESSTSVVYDSTPPVAQIVQPAAEQRVRSGSTVVVTAGESRLAVVLNGENMVPDGDGRWTGKVTSDTLTVELYDLASNPTVLTRHVVLDNSGPTATAVYPVANAHVRGTFTSTVYGVTDPGGVAYAQLWANGVYVGADLAYPYSLPVKTGTRSGTVSLIWKLTDKLGNQRSYTRYVVADNTAPTVSITKAPANRATVSGTVKVYVSAKDSSGIAKVQLLINGKVVATDATASYVLSVNTKKVAKTMKVQVRVYDKLGNVRYTSTRTWYRK